MKTTVDISDQLFDRARRLAAQQGITMRALIEAGLRAVLDARRAAPARFALRDVSFKGDGLAAGVELDNWPHVRSLIYDEADG